MFRVKAYFTFAGIGYHVEQYNKRRAEWEFYDGPFRTQLDANRALKERVS